MPDLFDEFPDIAERIGPHKRGKSCWYIKELNLVDESAVRDLITSGLEDLARHAKVEPT